MLEADDIARQYEQGKWDFSGLKLRGLLFEDLDLSGADFSRADLRGASFRRSVLRNVNFTEAKIGLRQQGFMLLMLGLLLTAGLLGVGAGVMGTIVNQDIRAHTNQFEEVIAGWTMVLLLIGYASVSVLHGLKAGFSIFLVAFALSLAVAITGPSIVQFIHPLALSLAFAISNAITIVAAVLAATVTATLLMFGGWAAIGKRAGIAIAAVFLLGFYLTVAATQIVAAIVAVVPCAIALTGYQCWRSLKGDGRHSVLRRLMLGLASRWGTSFESADLTDANFTGTRLKNANFDNANLTRTRWSNGVQTEVLRLFVDSFVPLK